LRISDQLPKSRTNVSITFSVVPTGLVVLSNPTQD
jgi:hypothetical protein